MEFDIADAPVAADQIQLLIEPFGSETNSGFRDLA
jgi:hypothetical protein